MEEGVFGEWLKTPGDVVRAGDMLFVVEGEKAAHEIESFASATTAGIGIRVVRDHRQGFAWAGSLEPDVVAETLTDARDNAAFAEPDDWVGLAEPDGSA